MERRDPEFVPKAVAVLDLELHPPDDGPLFSVDEKTGIGIRQPTAPSQAAAPGRPARREFEYRRNGTAALLAAFDVGSGQVHGLVRQRHRACEFIELLCLLDGLTPPGQVVHLLLDNLAVHKSAEVAGYLSTQPGRFRCHWLPKHGSWLSFIEVWFAILQRKCLDRSEAVDFPAAAEAITGFIATYDEHQAHPFTWRKGVQFYQRLKDQLAHSATTVQAAA